MTRQQKQTIMSCFHARRKCPLVHSICFISFWQTQLCSFLSFAKAQTDSSSKRIVGTDVVINGSIYSCNVQNQQDIINISNLSTSFACMQQRSNHSRWSQEC